MSLTISHMLRSLYGISTLQTYVYLIRFPRDSPELKIWWGMVSNGSVAGHESFAKRSFFASAVLNLVVAAVVQWYVMEHSLGKGCTLKHHFPIGTDEAQSLFVIAHLALGACATVKVVSTFERPASRAISLPDLVFCKTKLKPGVAGPSTSVTEREVCPVSNPAAKAAKGFI
ncbi:hypothetical protein VTO73DRAFT_8395 [Trametes versicolor]